MFDLLIYFMSCIVWRLTCSQRRRVPLPRELIKKFCSRTLCSLVNVLHPGAGGCKTHPPLHRVILTRAGAVRDGTPNGKNAELGIFPSANRNQSSALTQNSKATTRYFSQRVMPAALFRAGKKRSFGLYISSVPDGTVIIAGINVSL
jgi:hypothetical protein